jgi:PAS domain-containing protein
MYEIRFFVAPFCARKVRFVNESLGGHRVSIERPQGWIFDFISPASGVLRGGLADVILGVTLVAGAWLLTLGLYRFMPALKQHGLFGTFLLAVVVAAWQGGWLAALVATILSGLSVAWLMPPGDSFKISRPEDVIRFVLFLFISLLITYLRGARLSAERRLLDSELRFHLVLKAASVGYWDIDFTNGRFWRSENLPALFGREPSDFATTYEGFFSYLYPEDREFFDLAHVGSGSTQRDYKISHRIICGDETLRQVNTRGRMYFDEQGKLQRMVGAVFPIEEIMDGPRPPRMSGLSSIKTKLTPA